MGWSLKKPKKNTFFTAEQRQYLTEQFIIGEERGKKADPKDVYQEMHKLRDESGARLFRGKDVLTPQQVAGFFSRMAAKTQKSSSTQGEESESEDEKRTMQLKPNDCVQSSTQLLKRKLLCNILLFLFPGTFAAWRARRSHQLFQLKC